MRNEDMDIGFDRYMKMNNGNYHEHYSEESIDNMKTDFFAGAEWRINSVWHDASEMPEKKFALVEYDCFPKGHRYLVVPDAREVIESITRWAYMEDLIPNMEE